MKKGLLISLILIIFGGLIFFGILATYDFDFVKVQGGTTVEKTYEVNDSFSEIKFDVSTGDIRIAKSEDGKVRAVTRENEKITFTVKAENNSLEIKRIDNRRFFEKLFNPSTPVTLYLPEGDYGKLVIDATTSDISIAKDFTFTSLNINGTTGDISVAATVGGKMAIDNTTGDIRIASASLGETDIKVTTGDVKLNNISVSGNLSVKLTTGELEADNLRVNGALNIKSASGDISLSDVVCHKQNEDITSSVAFIGFLNIEATSSDVELDRCLADKIYVDITTGEVELDSCDAPDIYIETTTGDVEGTLLTGKSFDADATSGKVRVPSDSSEGGVCRIRTTSGDIEITIVKN